MIEFDNAKMHQFNIANVRLKNIKLQDLKVGKNIETTVGKEFIIKKENEREAINKEIKMSTITNLNLGRLNGILETEYNLLSNNKDGWQSGYILMYAYFTGDKKYVELNKKMESSK